MRILAALFALPLLIACEQVTKVSADMVLADCAFSNQIRRANLDEINTDLANRGATPRATANDCDGDGQPDPI